MQLSDLKTTWSNLTRSQKLDIISKSNDRRLEAFENRKKKSSKSRKKSKKKKSRKRKKTYTPSTPEGLMALKEKMSEEEWENFKMMVNSGQL